MHCIYTTHTPAQVCDDKRGKERRDGGEEGCQDRCRMKEGSRKEGKQKRRDVEKEGCKKRRDSGKGGMQERRDS